MLKSCGLTRFCARVVQTLDLAGNQLDGNIPSNLGGPRRLRFLHLGFNQLTGELVPGRE